MKKTVKLGILLVNLGSPDSPKAKDVKKYLNEFLMDACVIDLPLLLRALLVKGIILNFRPKKSAAAYAKVWTSNGSPLITISYQVLEKLRNVKPNMPIALAMRYGNPSIKNALHELVDQRVQKVIVIPLYPQYAMATSQTIAILTEKIRKSCFENLQLEFVHAFYNQPLYIKALASKIKNYLQNKTYDHLLFSYHGIPLRHIYKTDPTKTHCKIDHNCCSQASPAHHFCYRHQCYQTTKNVAEFLNLKLDSYSVSFQSRLGKDPWLEPYTDATIVKMAKNGIKNLAVVTPAFVSDCLETLEEIAMEGKEEFLEAGGSNFYAIPCLNDDDLFIDFLKNLINEYLEI